MGPFVDQISTLWQDFRNSNYFIENFQGHASTERQITDGQRVLLERRMHKGLPKKEVSNMFLPRFVKVSLDQLSAEARKVASECIAWETNVSQAQLKAAAP